MVILVPQIAAFQLSGQAANVSKIMYGKIAFCMGRPSEQHDSFGSEPL